MMEDAEKNRAFLKQALDKAGIRPSIAAQEIGRDKGYVRDYLVGRKSSLRADDYEKLLKLINPKETVSDRAKPYIASSRIVGVRIAGFVQAGIWQEIDSMDVGGLGSHTVAADPRYPIEEQFLLIVRGDSMDMHDPPIKAGSLIKCVSFAAFGRDCDDGDIVVVQRTRDGGSLVEATVKQMQIFPDRIELHPRSSNPRHMPITIPRGGDKSDDEIRIVAVVLDVIWRMKK